MTQNDTYADSKRGSAWGDCAECGSIHTHLGPVDEGCLLVCEDCGAHTEGINKWSAL